MANRTISDLWRTLRSFFRVEGGFEGKEISKPSTPDSGYRRFYPKSGGWYDLSSAGIETKIGDDVLLVNQTDHGFSVGNVLRRSTGTYLLAQADTEVKAEVAGIVKTVIDENNFLLGIPGSIITGLSSLTDNTVYFLSPTVAGAITDTAPDPAIYISRPVLLAFGTTSGRFLDMRGAKFQSASGVGALGEVEAGEALSEYDLIYYDQGSSSFKKSQNDGTEAEAYCCAMVIESGGIANGQTGTAIFGGQVDNAAWSVYPGQPLFVSGTAGAFTQVQPSTIGLWVRPVAIGLPSGQSIYFNPQTGWLIQSGIVPPIRLNIDGLGSVISTGVKTWRYCPDAGTIKQIIIVADQPGAIQFDIWKRPFADGVMPAVGNTICGGDYPALVATNQFGTKTTFTGWNLIINAGDIIRWNVNSCTTITKVEVTVVLE
jgi:hypothetical protein